MILVKIHRAGISEVVCVCDANLINKRFEQGNRGSSTSQKGSIKVNK